MELQEWLILQGMSRCVVFAMIPDLRVRLNTTVEGMSTAFSIGLLGCLVSTPLGILADRLLFPFSLIIKYLICDLHSPK